MIGFDVSSELLQGRICCELQEKSALLEADFGLLQEVVVSEAPYEGAYEVTPTVEGFSLPTAKKTLSRNINVRKIPIYETGNTAGGETVYIAADLNE